MGIFGIISLGLSLILATIPWFYPDLEIHWKIVIVLGVFVCYLLLAQIRLYLSYKKTIKKLNQTNERHTALSQQFDAKVIKEKKYQRNLDMLGNMLIIAVTNKKEVKLDTILKSYLTAQNDIDDEGE